MKQTGWQRSNKGFSLVELIVVVLIMGIITVSLAPQVMKWVTKAKENADFRARDDLKAVAQVAIASFEYMEGTIADAKYNITSSGITVVGGTDANPGMKEILEDYMHGTYPKVQAESGKVFQIQTHETGQKVTVNIVTGTY